MTAHRFDDLQNLPGADDDSVTDDQCGASAYPIRPNQPFGNSRFVEVALKSHKIGEAASIAVAGGLFGLLLATGLCTAVRHSASVFASLKLTVTPDQARQYAQTYLDQAQPGVKVGDDIVQFYGYYTLHTFKDGKEFGMLSVNGYSGQVWYHTWHGAFIKTSGD